MTDVEVHSAQAQTRRTCLSRPDANHPLPLRPMAHVHPEPGEVSATTVNGTVAAEGAKTDEAVVQLAAALQTAERAHCAYVAELLLGDVKPAEEWSTWYAEYLLGLR